jgi:hypothetical protein
MTYCPPARFKTLERCSTAAEARSQAKHFSLLCLLEDPLFLQFVKE